MEEKIAKAQVRVKVLDIFDIPPLQGEEDPKGRSIIHNNQMTDANVALDKEYENWNEFKLGNSLFRNGDPNYTPSDHNSQSEAVSKMLCHLLKQQGEPEADIDVFQGILSNITTSWKYSRK